MGISQTPQALVGATLGGITSASSSVATLQTTTSSTYTDLATVGPTVTLTTGTKALVVVSSYIDGGVTDPAVASFEVSGATTIAASDTYALRAEGESAYGISRTTRLTTLNAGSNTFTMKYRATGGTTGNYSNREIIVIDLGS